jgi:hypothetical protein
MRSLFVFLVLLGTWAHGASPIFRQANISPSEMGEREARIYASIQSRETTVRSRIVQIDEDALSRSLVRLDLFDDERAEFEVTKDPKENFWRGRGANFDRFGIREINGRYVGRVLYRGQQYALTSVGDKGVVLIKLKGHYECGVGEEK